MSLIVKIGWIAGVCAVIGLIFWTGAEPVLHAVQTAGWAVVGVVLLRGTAVAGAGVGWFALFPHASRPNAVACILIRFLREGANTLLPMTQIGGEVIGARVLSLRGAPASLAAASVIVDVLAQAATQFLFALIGLATLGAMGRGAVRLASAGKVLGIAEGTETGLSARQLFDVPVWCSLGAERLGKLELPREVLRVIVLGDIGSEAAAYTAREVYRSEGREAEVRFPTSGGKDFNDQLRAGMAA